jgi:hypothetical protein
VTKALSNVEEVTMAVDVGCARQLRWILASLVVVFAFLVGAVEATYADTWDNPHYGYCPDGTRVRDVAKCNRNPDGSCKPGRPCKPLPKEKEDAIRQR